MKTLFINWFPDLPLLKILHSKIQIQPPRYVDGINSIWPQSDTLWPGSICTLDPEPDLQRLVVITHSIIVWVSKSGQIFQNIWSCEEQTSHKNSQGDITVCCSAVGCSQQSWFWLQPIATCNWHVPLPPLAKRERGDSTILVHPEGNSGLLHSRQRWS